MVVTGFFVLCVYTRDTRFAAGMDIREESVAVYLE